jgi:phosphoglycerol transferase MdoB-like AlkP superfamily enzyme
MKNNSHNIKFNWKSKKSIPVYLLMFYFMFVLYIYLKDGFAEKIQKPVTIGILLLGIILILSQLLEIKAAGKFLNKYAIWINGFVLILSPVTSFLMVEIMVSNYNPDMFKAYSIYNLIWYYIIYYLLFALIRNARLTVIISNLLLYLASMVNYLVYLFRGNPILPSDLLAWQTGVSVASNYNLSFTKGFLLATLIMIAVFTVGYKLGKTGRRIKAVNRIIGVGIYVIFASFVFHAFFETDLIKTKIKVIDFFAPKYTYCSYGTAFGFVANVQAMETEAPKGYSVDKVRAVLDQVKEEAAQNDTSEEKPNLIVIMNEAFSDLRLIGDYKTNMDYLPNIRGLEDNTTKGSLYVSVFGGATSDTEYEFLTGNSMAVMPQNCVPYQQFVTEPRDSLAQTLKDQGYYNIAIHPYEPSGYKRDLVYPLLGFDEFLSKKDFKDPELIRSFISDRSSYRKIIEEYENKGSESPLFIFNVTMQNHGGYSSSRIFDDKNTVTLTDYSRYGSVEQYLSLLRESDKAFMSLIDYFSKQEEHTIIVMFGDHQPIAYSQLHDEMDKKFQASYMDTLARKYVVPFILWANYDIPEDDVDKMSANYLSSYLLKTAGLKGTTYNDYLLGLYQEIPVLNALFYIDKEDRMHLFSENTSYQNMIMDYRIVGYNNALDKKNRLKEYYQLN